MIEFHEGFSGAIEAYRAGGHYDDSVGGFGFIHQVRRPEHAHAMFAAECFDIRKD